MTLRAHVGVTMDDAVRWLRIASITPQGREPKLASEIPRHHGSLQGLTNALRHAERYGLVSRLQEGRKPARWKVED